MQSSPEITNSLTDCFCLLEKYQNAAAPTAIGLKMIVATCQLFNPDSLPMLDGNDLDMTRTMT